jgi:hypothetical protein
MDEIHTDVGGTGVPHRPTHSYARLGTAGTIAAPFASTRCQDHTMLAGHALLRRPVFNTSLRRHRLRDEGRTSHNKRGRLPMGTEHIDTQTDSTRSPERNGGTYVPTILRMWIVNSFVEHKETALSHEETLQLIELS